MDGLEFSYYAWRSLENAKLSFMPAGELHLPTSRVVACDPGLALEFPDESEPLSLRVPPGAHPVFVSIANSVVVCAMLRITNDEPVRWETASREGQDGYGADFGTGCFASPEAIECLRQDKRAFEKINNGGTP